MQEQDKTKAQLIEELAQLRQRVAELEESEQRYRTLAESTTDVIYVLDRAGKLLYANRTAAGYYGVSPESLVGRTQQDLFPPEQVPSHLEHIRSVFETGQAQEEEALYRFGPEEVWLNVRTIPLRDDQGRITSAMGVCRNITEQKRAELAVREAEERFNAFTSNAPSVAWMKDEHGRHVYISGSYEKRFGVRLADWHGKTDLELWPPEVAREFRRNDLAVLASGQPLEVVEEVPGPDGTQCYWLNCKFPFRDASGARYVGGVGVEITERVRASEALQRAHDELEKRVEERTAELRKANEELAIFRRFAEASGQGFGMADMDGMITYLNPALCRMAGVERPEDAIGKPLTGYYPQGYALRRETEIIPAILREGYWEGELVGAPGGKSRTVLQHSFLIRGQDESPPRLASVITDITERKHAEDALRRSEERLRMAIAATNDAIWDCNLIDGTVRWNDNYAAMFGRPPETSNSWQWWIDRIHPEDRDRVTSSLKEAVQGAQRCWTAEYRFLRADGLWAEILDRAYLARNESGEAWRVVGAMLDITERKRAQAALERERRSLKHMLDASDYERQTIAYDIHDGLAQYLAGAIMQLEVYEHLKDTRPEEATKAFDSGLILVRQGHSEARRLISEVRPPILDEAGVVAAVAHMVHEQQQQRGPHVEFFSQVAFDRLDLVLENAVYRIVQEGLANACRHSRGEMVRVALLQREDKIDIEIRDWGVGFDPAAVEESRFGLAGIQDRARLLGGKCTIASTPGQGTTLVVELPLLKRTAEP